jgi:enterochelin esterase family protein
MSLEQHTITSASGEYTRDIWFLPGPEDKPHPLCLFLDGEYYIRDMQALPVITELRETGSIPPVTCLFVSHVSSEARHADFTCNDRYTKFIAEDIFAWARGRDGNIQSGDNVICGLSLSGLASTYITFRYPEIFSFSLCQSGSFWWLHGKEILFSPTKARFWLSVGDQETVAGVTHPPSGLVQEISQIEGVENAVKRIEALGGTTNYHRYAGGHAMAPWREELAPALKWLIGNPHG